MSQTSTILLLDCTFTM